VKRVVQRLTAERKSLSHPCFDARRFGRLLFERWQTITGGTTAFIAFASWLPGTGSQAAAVSYCGTTGVTGSATKYSRYAAGGYDADVRCY
jgi:hypothetical protein